jgi:hypothetical protein
MILQRPPPLLLQLGAGRRGARVSPPPLLLSTQPPIATTRTRTTTVARASISRGGDDALGPDEDLGLPRGEQRAAAAGRPRDSARLPPRAAKSTTTPRGRRGLPPKEPPQPKQKKPQPTRRTAIDLLSQQQREREQRSAAERADALYALAVRQGCWPPSSSSSSSSLPQSAPHDDSDSDDDEDYSPNTDSNNPKRRPLLFEEAAATLAQARLADRLRRKVAPRIANASSWESLHARVLPRDLTLLDERCTALLMAKLPSLRPGGGEGVGKTAAASSAAAARRRFDTMVGAVAVATAPKLAGFADAALANVMAGMAAASPVADLRFLRAWAETATAAERWSGEDGAADLLVTAGAAFGPALLSALLVAQDQDDEEHEEQRPSSPPPSAATAAAFAPLFFGRTAAAFSSGDLELRHVAPAARAAEALLRCGLPSPGAEWWRAAFATVVSGSGGGSVGDGDGDPRPAPRGSRATAQFAGAVASLGAALDTADPQEAAAAAREAAPMLEAELRARAEGSSSSSSSSSPLSPAGAAAALRGLSSIWRAAAASGDGPSAETVAAVAALWRRRGFRARAQAAAALCDELAAAARRGGAGPASSAFVPDAEWRAAFEAAVASRMCPPGVEPAGGGEEEGDDTALPAPLPRLRLRMRIRGPATAEAAGGPAEEAASLALSSLALFSGWRHRPGAGWLAAFALSTRDGVASWPPRVLSAALASLNRALGGGEGGEGSSGASSSVSPLWALAVLRSLASRASSSVDEVDRRALVDALAALPPLLGLGSVGGGGARGGGGGGALATLQALAPSRLSPADVAALRSLGSEVADPAAVKALLEMLG